MSFRPGSPEVPTEAVKPPTRSPQANRAKGFIPWLRSVVSRKKAPEQYGNTATATRLSEKTGGDQRHVYSAAEIKGITDAFIRYSHTIAPEPMHLPGLSEKDWKVWRESMTVLRHTMYPTTATTQSLRQFQKAVATGKMPPPIAEQDEHALHRFYGTVMIPLIERVLHLGKYHYVYEFKPPSQNEPITKEGSERAFSALWNQPIPLGSVQNTLGKGYDAFCYNDILEQVTQDDPNQMTDILTKQMSMGFEGFTAAQTVARMIFRVDMPSDKGDTSYTGKTDHGDFAQAIKILLTAPFPKEAITRAIQQTQTGRPFTLGLLLSQLPLLQEPYYKHLLVICRQEGLIGRLTEDFVKQQIQQGVGNPPKAA